MNSQSFHKPARSALLPSSHDETDKKAIKVAFRSNSKSFSCLVIAISKGCLNHLLHAERAPNGATTASCALRLPSSAALF